MNKYILETNQEGSMRWVISPCIRQGISPCAKRRIRADTWPDVRVDDPKSALFIVGLIFIISLHKFMIFLHEFLGRENMLKVTRLI